MMMTSVHAKNEVVDQLGRKKLSGNRQTDGHDRSPHLDTDAVNNERTTCRSTVIVAVASLGLQCFDAVGWAAGRASGQ